VRLLVELVKYTTLLVKGGVEMTIVVLHNVGNDRGNLVLYHDTYGVWQGGIISRTKREICECDPKCQAQKQKQK
jgi:hypothetical protein